MDDEKVAEETSSRGNEWEVVSLTTSTYAAAPGPIGFPSNDDDRHHGNEFSSNEDEASRALFMSGHFVFPPSQHENLPLDPDDNKIYNEPGDEGLGPKEKPGSDVEVGERSDNVKGVEFLGDLCADHGRLSVHDAEFESGKAFQGLNLVEEDQGIYETAKFSSFHSEADMSESIEYGENIVIPEPSDPAHFNVDSHSDSSESSNSTKGNKFNGSGLPCEAWWKRHAVSLYAQAKEANAFWSVFVAAALMGLVILGQQWQQESWKIQQLKWQFSVNDEKLNWMTGPIIRFKDVIVGGHRRGSVIKGTAFTER